VYIIYVAILRLILFTNKHTTIAYSHDVVHYDRYKLCAQKQQVQIVDSFIKNVNALFYVLDDSRNGHERDYTSQIASITTNQISISIGHHWLVM